MVSGLGRGIMLASWSIRSAVPIRTTTSAHLDVSRMLEHATKGVIVGCVLLLVVGLMIAAVRGAKKGGGGAAALILLLQFFSPIPPPRQTVEDARDAEGKKRSEDQGRDGGVD